MENATEAYDAFNRLWGKVPRSCRVDRENHQLMLAIRAFFDDVIGAAKRAAIVDSALAAAKASPNTEDGSVAEDEDVEPADPVRQALRLLRTLSGLEWAMVKAVVDLHKFSNEDVADLVNVIRDTHCKRCGEWLDDDDEHENCPVPEEEEDEEDDVEGGSEAEPEATSDPHTGERDARERGASLEPAAQAATAMMPPTQAPQSEPEVKS